MKLKISKDKTSEYEKKKDKISKYSQLITLRKSC